MSQAAAMSDMDKDDMQGDPMESLPLAQVAYGAILAAVGSKCTNSTTKIIVGAAVRAAMRAQPATEDSSFSDQGQDNIGGWGE